MYVEDQLPNMSPFRVEGGGRPTYTVSPTSLNLPEKKKEEVSERSR